MSKVAKITLWLALLLFLPNFLVNMYNTTFNHTHSHGNLEKFISFIVIYLALTGKRYALYLCFIYSCLSVILTLSSFFYPDFFSVSSLFHMNVTTTRFIKIMIHSLFGLIIYIGAIKKEKPSQNVLQENEVVKP